MRALKGFPKVLAVSVALGAGYAAVHAAFSVLFHPLTFLFLNWANALIWVVSGTLICLSISPMILHSRTSRPLTFILLWVALALVVPITALIQHLIDDTISNFFRDDLLIIFIQFLVAGSAVWLLASPPAYADHTSIGTLGRGWPSWLWRVIAATLLNVALVFFITNYPGYSITGYFYTSDILHLLPQVLMRGFIIALAAIPLSAMLKAPRHRFALSLGTFLFVVVSISPFLDSGNFRLALQGYLSNPYQGLAPVLYSDLINYFLLGLTIGYLYGFRPAQLRDVGERDHEAGDLLSQPSKVDKPLLLAVAIALVVIFVVDLALALSSMIEGLSLSSIIEGLVLAAVAATVIGYALYRRRTDESDPT